MHGMPAMSRILCVWELGGGAGHLNNLKVIGGALRSRGHEVCFALKDLAPASRFFDLSDGDGKGQGKLATGQYVLKIRKLGYKNVSKTIVLKPDMDKKIVIELQPEN